MSENQISSHPGKEVKVFFDCQLTKENIMLRTEAETLPDAFDVGHDVVAVHGGRTAGRRKQTSEHGEGGGLTGTVMTQQDRNLALKHIHRDTIHCNFTFVKYLVYKKNVKQYMQTWKEQ